ncbi:MAG: hypothetical protein QOH63_3499 [Acidobacteriota bacterium]|jgi:hypothetical protein|nr:hypothetical protein [Acidobacteriota bacterium]
MSKLPTNLFREIRPNLLYDLIKYMVIGAVSLLIVFGYRILAWVREIPHDRVVDIAIFATAFLLLSIAYGISKHQRRAIIPNAAQPEAVETETQESEALASTERIIVNVMPEYLMSFYHEHTGIQAEKLFAAYKGKWIKVAGKLGDVRASEDYSTVAFEYGSPETIIMFFYEEWTERLSILRRGDSITVLGQIEKGDAYTLTLDNCELVHP